MKMKEGEYDLRRRKKRLMKKKDGEYTFWREKKIQDWCKWNMVSTRLEKKNKKTEEREKWWVRFLGRKKTKTKKRFHQILSGSCFAAIHN